jgi:hypothetical protein
LRQSKVSRIKGLKPGAEIPSRFCDGTVAAAAATRHPQATHLLEATGIPGFGMVDA